MWIRKHRDKPNLKLLIKRLVELIVWLYRLHDERYKIQDS